MWHRQRRKADEDDTNDRRFGVGHQSATSQPAAPAAQLAKSEGKGLNA